MISRINLWLAGLVAGLLAVLIAPGATSGQEKPAEPSAAAARFFESKVRPILADNCHKCHGEMKQRGGLRLDSRAAILTGGEQGPAIVPGQPEKSRLIKAIRHEEDLRMPPTKKLTKEQIADLTQWVAMGAPWAGTEATAGAPVRRGEFQITAKDRAHWAFQPVKRSAVPEVKDQSWISNPIDAFILARLEAKGLRPNPPAAKHELLRRLYYDLTGLPPTPQEVEAFLADNSPEAYTGLVDRLLDSPRYGETWGRHWLDLVRFAETNSYERDNPKPHAWRYRDYVIRSFNDDKPFDRFIREQLAGDELPDGGADGLIATGYYRLGIWDDEPTDREQARYDGLDDMVATTAQVFLGLTVDCARCHDHKIDPIPQKDYYRLVSFFQNINHFRNGGPTDEAPLLHTAADRLAHERRVRDLEQKRNDVQATMTAIEEEFRTLYQKDRGERVRGTDLDELHYRFYRDTWDRLPDFTTLKEEEAGELPLRLFDLAPRSRNEAFGFVFEGQLIVPKEGRYTLYLDSDDGARLTIDGKTVIDYDGVHVLGQEKQASLDLAQGRLPIKLEYFQKSFGYGLKVAWSGPGVERRFLSATGGEKLEKDDLHRLIAAEGPKLLGKERTDRYASLKRELDVLKKQKVPTEMALCVSEAGARPPDTFVLIRGNPHAHGAKVEPAFLEVLNVPAPVITSPAANAKTSGRRTALADWIAARDNPLSARVIVNRIWQHHFGRGIVRSANNFGTQGDKPTHPELLDWLASEFASNGWRMKALHRLIVTSNAYRMSSRGKPEALAADPTNDLFWRFDMRRLTAEEIRDSILAVTGSLNLKMYGPGVYPEIPKEVLAGQSKPGYGWGKSPPEEQNRRSVYVHVKRSLLVPILESFDAAETDRSSPARFATTQPTQALLLLNSEFLSRQASAFAARLRRDAGEDAAKQVRLALSLVTGRRPRDEEVRRGVDLMESLKQKEGATADEALAYFCLIALNLNESVYLD